jgi:hypothetical protein
MSVRLAIETIHHLRQIVRDHAGAPLYLTITGVVEQAILRELARLEAAVAKPVRKSGTP